MKTPIDLYVTPDRRDDLAEARITFLAHTKRRIGEQKIDLVVASDTLRVIDQIAQEQGILLCQNH